MKFFIKVITFFIVVSLNVAHGAIINDSTIVVLANWKKHESQIYKYSQYNYKVCGTDTIDKSKFSRDFIVEVDDSTQHLYSLKYSRCALPSSGDSIVLDEFPLQLMTNHSGGLIKVLNWESYLAWRNNDVERTSDDLMPFVAMLSFNGKRLKVNYEYSGTQIVGGCEVGLNDSVMSMSKMTITQDFKQDGAYEIITINTLTTYSNIIDGSPIPVYDKFTQVVDSENGWTLATYLIRCRKDENGENVESWTIKLL